MRASTFLMVLTAALLFRVPSAMAQQPGVPPLIDVVVTTGEGVIQAVPDRAWITVIAETRAPNAREAQRRNTEAMKPVQDALRNARIPADAIRTVGYDLQEEFDFPNNKRVSRGYVARNSIEIRVDDVNRVGELLELSVGQGATRVGGLRFDLKEQAKLEREALRQAVADARAKAEAAASGAGRTVDRVIRVEETGASPRPQPMFRAVAMEARAADAPVPVSTGQIEVRAQATVTLAVK
jgi:uncharacterized protein YggE